MNKLLFSVVIASAILISGCNTQSKSSDSSGSDSSGIVARFAEAIGVSTLVVKSCSDLAVASKKFTPPTYVKKCWELEVPEDYASPTNGKTIKVAVARVEPIEKTATSAIVMLGGGPGGATIEEAEAYENLVLRANNILYLVDQRGTGFSTPSLYCDFNFTSDQEKLRQCRAALLKKNVNLSAYTSRYNALDFIVLRNKLAEAGQFSGQWTLYGASYGTRLALTILREDQRLVAGNTQSKASTKAMVLDGTLPVQISGTKDVSWSLYANLKRISSVCETSTGCNLNDVRGKITAQVTDLSDDHNLQRHYFNMLVELMKNADTRGDAFNIPGFAAIPLSVVRNVVQSFGNDLESDHSGMPGFFLGMGLSVICANDFVFPAYYTQPHPEHKNWAQPVRDAVNRYFHLGFSKENCQIWNVPSSDSEEGKAVKSSTVPVLIVNGGNDGQTPPAWGDLVKQDLKNSVSITDDTKGHVVIFDGNSADCMHTIIKSFIESPDLGSKDVTTLDPTCLSTQPQFAYR